MYLGLDNHDKNFDELYIEIYEQSQNVAYVIWSIEFDAKNTSSERI